MEDLVVRKATLEDQSQLLELFQHYRYEKAIKIRIECYLSHNNTIIAKWGNQIIGIVQWHVKEDPTLGVAEFEDIFVVEEHRMKGIGSALIKFSIHTVINYFNNLGIKPRRIFLFVNEQNNSARKLYKKFGFKCVSDIGNLFFDNETELFYALDLKNLLNRVDYEYKGNCLYK